MYFQRDWSTKSDVWSFGVTLWELYAHCQSQPLSQLTDEQVEENLVHLYRGDCMGRIPARPANKHLSKEVTGIMFQCWKRAPSDRPSFKDLHEMLSKLK